MALPILDGNQTAVTLATTVSGGQHFPNHIIASGTVTANLDPNSFVISSQIESGIGSYAADLANDPFPISGTVTVGSLPAISGTVTANPTGTQTIAGTVTASVAGNLNGAIEAYDTDGSVSHKVAVQIYDPNGQALGGGAPIPISGTVTANINDPTNALFTTQIGDALFGSDQLRLALEGTLISGTVTVGNSVTISSLPAISGTVTANVLAGQYTTITASSVSIGSNSDLIDISNFPNGAILSVEAQPTGGGNGVYKIQHIDGSGFGATDISVTNIFTGASAVNISASSTYSFRKNQFQTHLRFTYVSGTGGNALYKILAFSESYWNQTIPISISSVTVGNSVTIGSLPAISGTVTANSSNGSLTTRFGSVTTANTAFATSAVTNANRKYLLIQNITTASNLITVGIGFTPTTTQGIQLSSGAGLTFEGSYIPTGAVNLLSSVTASCFTILEA
jgi:hypothetical protein